ncbi:uncharacterized protein G2W53_022548 [Senna tora]|uniref:Uncharacterized protein n=1 Tax=Senna tora TaxID=362788 RepID=A0A834WP84_9FABA|nr:uncharacterized protein G2W53_022548 [Senna tora]
MMQLLSLRWLAGLLAKRLAKSHCRVKRRVEGLFQKVLVVMTMRSKWHAARARRWPLKVPWLYLALLGIGSLPLPSRFGRRRRHFLELFKASATARGLYQAIRVHLEGEVSRLEGKLRHTLARYERKDKKVFDSLAHLKKAREQPSFCKKEREKLQAENHALKGDLMKTENLHTETQALRALERAQLEVKRIASDFEASEPEHQADRLVERACGMHLDVEHLPILRCEGFFEVLVNSLYPSLKVFDEGGGVREAEGDDADDSPICPSGADWECSGLICNSSGIDLLWASGCFCN